MKKRFYYLPIVVICLFLGCKKEKEIVPDVVAVDDSFIKSIRVNGAKEVKIDSDKRIIQIVLPESYSSEKLDLNLDLSEGSKAEVFPDIPLIQPGLIRYLFRGTSPLSFTVSKKDAQLNGVKQYTVFVKQEGQLGARLVSEPVFYASDNDISVYAEFVLTSGIGSVPETPNEGFEFKSILTDPAKGLTGTGPGYASTNTITIVQGAQFLKSDRMILGISYGDKKFDFPEIRQIRRPITAGMNSFSRFLQTMPKGKTMEIGGGVFLPENQYHIELSNDRMPSPRTFAATFASYSTLTFKLPDDLPDDHYLVQIYEDSTVIGKGIEPVASAAARKSVGAVWTEFVECPTIQITQGHDTGRVVVSKGQTFYVMPLPGIMDGKYGGSGMDPNKPLPALELKSGSESLLLQPTVKADWCYGDGGIYLYYGVFKIPANAPSGKYEARFISKDNTASLPYWSRIEIR